MSTIVVGVDGSEAGDAALRWALAEARLRGVTLRVVHAYQAPHPSLTEAGLGAAGGMPVPAVFIEDREQVRRAAETQAAALIEEALGRVGNGSGNGVEIERTAVEGPAGKSLIESARGAELLVVGGSRGHGGLLGLVLGSVSRQCAEHPPCPVVIAPRPAQGG
jgi:nucleotide-binding universal stress UspA family protein